MVSFPTHICDTRPELVNRMAQFAIYVSSLRLKYWLLYSSPPLGTSLLCIICTVYTKCSYFKTLVPRRLVTWMRRVNLWQNWVVQRCYWNGHVFFLGLSVQKLLGCKSEIKCRNSMEYTQNNHTKGAPWLLSSARFRFVYMEANLGA